MIRYFLSAYDSDSFFIRKKTENTLYCSIIYAIMLLIGLCLHTFSLENGTVFQLGDVVASVFNILALIALKHHKLKASANLLYASICFMLIIHNIIGDYIAAEPLTHYRVLQTTVTFFLLYFIISLTATKIHQVIVFVSFSLLIITIHTTELLSEFYKWNPDSIAVSHFVSYYITAVFGGILCYLVLKINNAAIDSLDKRNEQLEEVVEDRTKKVALLFEEKEAYYKRALETEAIIKGIIENADDIFYTLDINGIFTFISPQIEKITGFKDEKYLGEHYFEIFQSDTSYDIISVAKTKVDLEVRFVNGFGQVQWFSAHSSPISVNGISYIIGVARDITDKKSIESTLVKYATMDVMTGTLNRYAGLETLSELLTAGISMTVCYIDLDDLKLVNDTYGHHEGDYLISTVVESIRKYIDEKDILCRIGGDEFILILPDRSINDATDICTRIIANLVTIKNSKPKPYHMSFSYGCEEIVADTHPPLDSVIRNIDNKMYLQKALHKNAP